MALNFWREEKQTSEGMHVVCRRADTNELKNNPPNLPGEEVGSAAALVTDDKPVHYAIGILFGSFLYFHNLASIKSTHGKGLHEFILFFSFLFFFSVYLF